MITFHGPTGSIRIDKIDLYSDNTPMVKHDRWDEIVECDTVTVQANSLQTLTTALFMVDAVNWRGGWIKNLILPYLPGARQDRMNPTGDVLFTAWSVAQMINQRKFSNVVAIDPHSETMPRFIENFREYPLHRALDFVPDVYTGVISPDKGATTRAENAALFLGVGLFQGRKERDVATGQLTGFEVDSLTPGAHYLVVDDICDGGGTFLGLAEKIAEQGCTADLFVTHGIFSKGTTLLRKAFGKIYSTDSLGLGGIEGVKTIRIVEDMENYL